MVTEKLKFKPLWEQIEYKLNCPLEIFMQKKKGDQIDAYPIVRKNDSILIKYWWSESPIENKELYLPIISSQNQQFNGEFIKIDELIFNQPIRRDLIHKVHHWSLMYNKVNTVRGKRPWAIDYSNKKQRPQKGSGKARMGSLKSCGRIKGGKAFGPIPKIYEYHLNVKTKLKGICAALSAKLAEGKIIILSDDNIKLSKDLKNNIVPIRGSKELFLFVHSKEYNEKLINSLKLIPTFKPINPNKINMIDLLKYDKIIFTEQSLKEFQELILAYTFFMVKPKIIENEKVSEILNLDYKKQQPDAKYKNFDPKEEFEFSFNILNDYYRKYSEYRDKGLLKDKTKYRFNQFTFQINKCGILIIKLQMSQNIISK